MAGLADDALAAPEGMRRRTVLQLMSSAAAAAGFGRARLADAAVTLRTQSPHDVPEAIAAGKRPLFFLDQVGFLPGQPKVATVVWRQYGMRGEGDGHAGAAATEEESAGPAEFAVWDVARRSVVFRGVLSRARVDAASGDLVALADFSRLTRVGRFRLKIADAESESFTVGEDVFSLPLRLATRAFYGQRCGCAVDLGHGYRHAACHAEGSYGVSSGRSGALPNAGGWHDAGDYGRYVVNSGITCGTLLWAWEMFPRSLRQLRLGYPRWGVAGAAVRKGRGVRGLPDFLTEVRWNLEWMLQMQDQDGGVFHKQTSDWFCAFLMPEQDRLPSHVMGTGAAPFKSTAATADLAAVMAIAARCYRPYDAPFADRALTAARAAWRWAAAHPDVVFRNPPGVTTGEYGDRQVADELLWACAELFRTTGEAEFDREFRARARDVMRLGTPESRMGAPSWGWVGPMGCWAYAQALGGDEDLKRVIREETRTAAGVLKRRAAASGYGTTLAEREFGWGSNSTAANQSVLLVMAHWFEPDDAAIAAALGNLHYLLGQNCHGVSWVTGVGRRPFQHPHHRPSAADGIAAPWPGLLSGGPNAHPADDAARTLPPMPPMRMWLDDERAYSMNEVAINWNAPLVFLLAFADSRRYAAANVAVTDAAAAAV